MNAWLRATFEIVINGWDIGKDSFSFQSADEKIVTSSVDWFVSAFPISGEPTCDKLKAIDPSNSKGWNVHFDAWKEQGKIQ